MNSNDAAHGVVTRTASKVDLDNVAEIFPGASNNVPVANRPIRSVRSRWWRPRAGLEAGMATAEYAIATLAVVILKSDEVRGFLMNIIRTALSM